MDEINFLARFKIIEAYFEKKKRNSGKGISNFS